MISSLHCFIVSASLLEVACLNTTYLYPFSVKSAPSQTTLRGSVPVECEEYQILDDYSRNSRCGQPGHSPWSYCDHNDRDDTSPDWRGGNRWYRFLPPAGLVMPEYPQKVTQCGTGISVAPGWLHDSHPEGHCALLKKSLKEDMYTFK